MPYKILSLSGGGVRGIYQAVFLKTIAPSLQAPFRTNFDLIAGTSTGSIVAVALSFEVDLGAIVELFETKGPEIFSARWFSKVRKGSRYSAAPLRKALAAIFKDATLGQAKTPLLVPATTLNKYAPRAFSPFHEQGTVYIDPDLKVVDVVMASCAAPTYFSPVSPKGDSRHYVDGGMWANSPSLDAVISAHYYLKKPLGEMKLLSLGNGEVALGADPQRFAKLRPLSKTMIVSVFDMMFAAQSIGADELTEMLLPTGNFKRVNSSLAEPINLDDAEKALSRLPPNAEADANKYVHELRTFLS